MATFVNAYGNTGALTWVQTGFYQEKESDCSTKLSYYWEKNTLEDGHKFTCISSPAPRGTHDFKLRRQTSSTICGAGVSYCWNFLIDGVSKHTCCGDATGFSAPSSIDAVVECYDPYAAACQATGIEDPIASLLYWNSSDVVASWAGKDSACLDYAAEARGKWVDQSNVKGGFNVSVSGSLTGPAC